MEVVTSPVLIAHFGWQRQPASIRQRDGRSYLQCGVGDIRQQVKSLRQEQPLSDDVMLWQ